MTATDQGTTVNANAAPAASLLRRISARPTLVADAQPTSPQHTVNVANDVTAQAILEHAEGHTRATRFGAGSADRRGKRHGNVNPTVTAYIGGARR